MLQFLRKHQKYIFIVVTFIVIATFVFFGTYQVLAPIFMEKEERVMFKDAAGKGVREYHFQGMCRYLATDGVLGDGVVSKEFFENGRSELIYKAFQERIESDLAPLRTKEKEFIPFVQKGAEQLSQEALWKVFAPDIIANLKKMQGEGSAKELFKARVALYLAERCFPAQLQARFLAMQANQQKLPIDSRLLRGEIALFGYRHLQEWFGESFVQSAASVIINGASLARARGLKVSQEEVLHDLQGIVARACEKMPSAKQGMMFQSYVQNLGVTEEMLVKIHQDVLLYRAFLEVSSGKVVVESLPFEAFYTKAGEAVVIELAQLPAEMRLRDREDLKRWEVYLEAVCEEGQSPLGVPERLCDVAQVEAKARELITYPFLVEVATVNKRDLEAKVTVRGMWEWQHENIELLRTEFSLPQGEVESILASLDPSVQVRVDRFAKGRIVQAHPEWVGESLAAARMEVKSVLLRPQGGTTPFDGVSDVARLKVLWDAQDEVGSYTEDGEHFYRFVVKERSSPRLLTFKEAKEALVVDQLLERFDVGARVEGVLASLLSCGRGEEEVASCRFVEALKNWPAQSPFKLLKGEKTIFRGSKEVMGYEEVAALGVGDVSPPIRLEDGSWGIYRVIAKKEGVACDQKVAAAQEFLKEELKGLLVEELLKERNAF